MRTGDLVIITEDRGDYGRTGVLLDPCPSPGSTAASVLIDGVRTTVPIHELRPATAEEQRAHVAGQRRRIEGDNIMAEQKVTRSGGMGFLGFLTLLFIALKLTGHIDWSWGWVLAPLWGPFAFAILLLLLAALLGGRR